LAGPRAACGYFPNPLCASLRSDDKLELQWNLEGHQLGVVSVDISHDGAIAASSSLDAHIRLWDLESGKQIKSMDAGPGKTGGLETCVFAVSVSLSVCLVLLGTCVSLI